MRFIIDFIPAIAFAAGIFIGYQMRKEGEKEE